MTVVNADDLCEWHSKAAGIRSSQPYRSAVHCGAVVSEYFFGITASYLGSVQLFPVFFYPGTAFQERYRFCPPAFPTLSLDVFYTIEPLSKVCYSRKWLGQKIYKSLYFNDL
jgi:hypothetical protein